MAAKKFTKKEVLLGIFCSIFVLIILTSYLWYQSESIRLGYKTGKLEERILFLKKEVEQLETKKTYLLTLSRVEEIAKNELKLKPPAKDQIFYYDFEKQQIKRD